MEDNKITLDGTIDVFKERLGRDLQTTNTLVKKAMARLKLNNALYDTYIPQGETVMKQQTVDSHFAGMPKWTDYMVIAHGGQLPIKDIANLEGFPVSIHTVYIPSCSNFNKGP